MVKRGSKETAVQQAKRPLVSMGSGQKIRRDIFKKIKVTRSSLDGTGFQDHGALEEKRPGEALTAGTAAVRGRLVSQGPGAPARHPRRGANPDASVSATWSEAAAPSRFAHPCCHEAPSPACCLQPSVLTNPKRRFNYDQAVGSSP
uniref:Uncharacterized protein n=1 Tax=Rousettus aegyptiacus TaxID=9407 RepID=A0A7J8DXZ5_ROUAE|nr:hypothetical protein HJG63_008413 [Rousettus aegyptiacus]